jgi:hypothetical protein
MGWVFVDVVRSAVATSWRSAEGDDNGTDSEYHEDEGGDDHHRRVHFD